MHTLQGLPNQAAVGYRSRYVGGTNPLLVTPVPLHILRYTQQLSSMTNPHGWHLTGIKVYGIA